MPNNHKKVTVFGASDDLIEVDGDLRGEFSGDRADVVFSDGTILRVDYSNGGVWTVDCIQEGTAKLTKVDNKGGDSDSYSDRVTLEGDISWCCVGELWGRCTNPITNENHG